MKLNYAEFYITNVCNLACPGCNRFNNYKFKGVQRWDQYKDVYAQWAKEINLANIGILGGEPLLNADFMDWAIGIRTLWPHANIRVPTNGFRLNYVDGLYDWMRKDKKVLMSVGIHNKMHRPQIMDEIEKVLTAPLKYKFDNNNKYQQEMYITDANGVRIRVQYNWWFHKGSIMDDGENITVYNSDVEKAHDNCHMRECHHFIRGQLYKCGVVALLPEFDQQFPLTLSPEDRELMLKYRPLDINDSIERKQDFVNNIVNSVEQCKFCPEVYDGVQIFAPEKKMIFKK